MFSSVLAHQFSGSLAAPSTWCVTEKMAFVLVMHRLAKHCRSDTEALEAVETNAGGDARRDGEELALNTDAV